MYTPDCREAKKLIPGDIVSVAVGKDTFLNFEDAKKISGNLVALAPPGMVWVDGYGTYAGVRVGGWDWAQHPDRINWNEYISGAQAGAK